MKQASDEKSGVANHDYRLNNIKCLKLLMLCSARMATLNMEISVLSIVRKFDECGLCNSAHKPASVSGRVPWTKPRRSQEAS